MKLISILKNIILEGAKVTFTKASKDSKPIVNAIDISPAPIPGEQLKTVSGKRKTDFYNVYYSLESSKMPGTKAAEDALKYDTDNKINQNDLKALITKTLKPELPKIDYIGFLESKGKLNQTLINVLKEIYNVSDDNVINIGKIQYEYIDDAVDWDQFRKESNKIKNAIIKFLYKKAEQPPKYSIRKSGETQSQIVQRLHSKYDLGLQPNLPNAPLPPIYDILVKCITQRKTLLIVDDNLHTGTDFLKIFRAIDKLVDKLKDEYSQPTNQEQEMFNQIEKIKQHPKFNTSPVLQNQYKELSAARLNYLQRTQTLTKDFVRVRERIFGYVLYRLSDTDLKNMDDDSWADEYLA
jgi:hypothetical protein